MQQKRMNDDTFPTSVILSFMWIGSNNVPDKAAKSYIWFCCTHSDYKIVLLLLSPKETFPQIGVKELEQDFHIWRITSSWTWKEKQTDLPGLQNWTLRFNKEILFNSYPTYTLVCKIIHFLFIVMIHNLLGFGFKVSSFLIRKA